MLVKEIKPSEVKNWDVIRHFPNSQLSTSTKALKDPTVYAYHFDEGKWHPVRKPTISEIINDKYK